MILFCYFFGVQNKNKNGCAFVKKKIIQFNCVYFCSNNKKLMCES